MNPLTFIITSQLVAAGVIGLIPKNYKFLIRVVALFAALLSMLVAVWLFAVFEPGASGLQFEQRVEWVPALGIGYHVGVDGLSVGLVLMGAIVAFAAVCVSREIVDRQKEYYLLLLVMSGGILGAFASLDLFCIYFFHELALVPTFLMIGIWGRGVDRLYATYQIAIYLSVGALIALIGLLALYVKTGAWTFDVGALRWQLSQMPLPAAAQNWIFPLLMFGFGILVSLWPFHTWAPVGYAAAPTGVAMMHAGVIKKFGLYGLVRVALPLLPEGAQRWMPLLAWLALGNVLYAGLVAMRQKNLNMLLGYSSVAHMGFAFLGVASLSVVGVTGMVVVMVAHGFLAALGFALSGYVSRATGTLEMERLGGLLRAMPFIGGALVMAMLAGCGVPGFANFPGELLVLFGAWDGHQTVVVLAVWAGLVVGAVYMLRAVRVILHGAMPERLGGVCDPTGAWQRLAYAILVGGLVLFGLAPGVLTGRIKPEAAAVLQLATGETRALVEDGCAVGHAAALAERGAEVRW